MKVSFTADSWADYTHWINEDPAMVRKINELIRDSSRNPFKGLGRPEPLKRDLAGWWSRRITGEHRLVYRVQGSGETQELTVAQCRYHY